MTVTVTLELDGGGRPVAVKRGRGPAADRIRREASLLGRLRHPGVVELLDAHDEPDAVALHLAWVGGPALSAWTPPGPASAARLLSALAQTVADLHDQSFSHGALEAAHVLVADADRPVLCGFGTGAVHAAQPADDLAGLVAVAAELADRVEPGGRGPFHDGVGRLTRRPAANARDLADAFAAMTELSPTRRRPDVRAGLVVAALVGVAVTALAAVAAAPSDHASRALPGVDAPTTTMPAAAPTIPATAPAMPVVAPQPAVEGTVPVVEVDGASYEVGRSGDLVVVAPWWCDPPRPAVLRPTSGEVFVFTSLPDRVPVATPPVTRVTDAVALRAGRAAGCAVPEVVDRTGVVTVIDRPIR